MPATCMTCGVTFEDPMALVQHVHDVHDDDEEQS